MPERLSTIKPKPKNPKPEVKLEYNDRSYQSYIDTGFADIIPQMIRGPRNRMQRFLAAVDLRKGPIERTVTMLVRGKFVDWESPKREKREYIYYQETFNAKNWLGVDIDPISDHFEGKYSEVVTRPVFSPQTGDHIDNEFAGVRDVYYIEFSKEKVDEIIAKSARTNKSNIRFVVKWDQQDSMNQTDNMPMIMSSRNVFTYDQFASWSWEKLSQWQFWPVDDLLERPKAFTQLQKQKAATKSIEFKPS
jgi:hypothetical protein